MPHSPCSRVRQPHSTQPPGPAISQPGKPPGQEFLGGRALGKKLHKHDRAKLLGQVRAIDEGAATRRDVEDIEIHHHDASYRVPALRHGIQVHLPYTAYAHRMILHRMLTGAEVRHLQANMDIDAMSRSAGRGNRRTEGLGMGSAAQHGESRRLSLAGNAVRISCR